MKNRPLKYIVLLIISLAVIILSVSSVSRVFINKKFVAAYDNEQYDYNTEKSLLFMNFPQSYLPYYNLGNVAYQKEEYAAAVSYYKSALRFNPHEPEDCQIRINLALALIHTIDFDNLGTEEKVQEALSILYQARDYLLENGCAVDEEGSTGHNEDAQQLKEDIDKMIEKLEQNGGSDNQDKEEEQNKDNDEQDDNSNSSSNSEKQKKQQQALEQNKKNAMRERQEEINKLEKNKKYRSYQSGDDEQDGGSGSDDENGGTGQESGYTQPW